MIDTGATEMNPWIGIAIEVLTVFGSVALVLFKLGRTVERFELIGAQQAKEITELKEAIKDIGKVITTQAVESKRSDVFAERLNRQDALIENLRRGEGYILPIARRLKGQLDE